MTLERDLLRRILLDLRVAVDDADTITADMMRPPHERELGPVLHRVQYREARGKIIDLIAYLLRTLEDDKATPSGGGGAPPH